MKVASLRWGPWRQGMSCLPAVTSRAAADPGVPGKGAERGHGAGPEEAGRPDGAGTGANPQAASAGGGLVRWGMGARGTDGFTARATVMGGSGGRGCPQTPLLSSGGSSQAKPPSLGSSARACPCPSGSCAGPRPGEHSSHTSEEEARSSRELQLAWWYEPVVCWGGRGAGKGRLLISTPASATQRFPRQPRLHSERSYFKNKKYLTPKLHLPQ